MIQVRAGDWTRIATFGVFFLCMLWAGNMVGQTALTNGGNQDGSISLFETNVWTFTGNTGDNVVLRSARLTAVGNFNPELRIYNPDGILIAEDTGNNLVVDEIALTMTNSGTFTVLVSDSSFGGVDDTGTYRLRYFNLSETWIVADDGGALTNGGNHDGVTDVGDLDPWSFAGNAGDQVVLRSARLGGDAFFIPWLRVYDPDGNLIAETPYNGGVSVYEIALMLTNSGSYTVLVADANSGLYDDAGDYRLYLAQFPGTFILADDGGPMANGVPYTGTIDLGDLDLWSFQVCRASVVTLICEELTSTGNFAPQMRLYAADGTLVATAQNASLASIYFEPTNSGTFTLLVDDGDPDNTGTYRLTGAGLAGDGLQLCNPLVVGTALNVVAVGGSPGTNGVLYTTTNLSPPAAWSQVWTNQFDSFGVFQYNHLFDPDEPARFFRVEQQ